MYPLSISHQMGHLFYSASDPFDVEELQTGFHHLNPAIPFALLLHPLTAPSHFYHLHLHLLQQQLNSALSTLQLLQREMRDAASSLPMQGHGRADSVYPDGVKLFGGEVGLTAYDNDHLYPSSEYFKQLLLDLPPTQIQRTAENSFTQAHFSSHRAFFFTTSVASNGSVLVEETTKHYQPFSVVHLLEYSLAQEKVNIVVPGFPVSQSLYRFVLSFENAFLVRNGLPPLSLLVVLFSNSPVLSDWRNRFSTSTLVELLQSKYPSHDLRLVTTQEPFSHHHLVSQAVQQYGGYELIFIASPHMIFSSQFLHHCIHNAMEGKQLYFPALFAPFDPAAYYKFYLLHPMAIRLRTTARLGTWLPPAANVACGYASDLATLLDSETDRGTEGGEWSLMGGCLHQAKLSAFFAPEPGIAHLSSVEHMQ